MDFLGFLSTAQSPFMAPDLAPPEIMTDTRNKSHPHRHHPDITTPANNLLQLNQDENRSVQDWLDNLCEANGDVAKETTALSHEQTRCRDSLQDFESGWCPNNLPIAPLAIHQQSEQREKRPRFLNDDTILTSPTVSLAGGSSSSQPDPRFEVESLTDKYTDDRYSPSTLAQESTSPKYTFEKQPRKRTRPDKYQTAGQKARAKHANPESTVKQKQSQPSITKRKLRSKRDIVNNFTSSAFSGKRLTMPPNLRAGLFMNGRSSKMPKKLTDLTFNDMSFLRAQDHVPDRRELQAIAGKMREDSRNDSNQEKDPILCLPNFQRQQTRSDEVSRSIIATPSSGLVATQAPCQSGDKNEPNGSSRAIPKCLQKLPDHQQNSGATNAHDDITSREFREAPHRLQKQTRLVQDPPVTAISDTPGSVLQALVDTGVFDGTCVTPDTLSAKHTDPEPQDERAREGSQTQSSSMTPPSHTPTYEDKRTMITPSSNPVEESKELKSQQIRQDCNQDSLITEDPKEAALRPHSSPVPKINPIGLLYRGIGFNFKADDGTFDVHVSEHSDSRHGFQDYEHRLGFRRTQSNDNSSHFQTSKSHESIKHPRLHEIQSEALEIGHFQAQRSLGPESPGAEELELHSGNGSACHKHSKYPFGDDSQKEYIELHGPIDPSPDFHGVSKRDQRKEFLGEVSPEVPSYKADPRPHNDANESMRDFIARIEAEVLSRDYDEEFLLANMNTNEVRGYEDGPGTERENGELDMASFWRPNWFM